MIIYFFSRFASNFLYLLIFLRNITGVAPIPFDPNDLPVSTDKEPWWKVVQSFYADDLRFDDDDDDNDE